MYVVWNNFGTKIWKENWETLKINLPKFALRIYSARKKSEAKLRMHDLAV